MSKKLPLWVQNLEKGRFKRLFLAKFDLSDLIFVKIVHLQDPTLIGTKKLQNTTLMGASRAYKSPSLWVHFFF